MSEASWTAESERDLEDIYAHIAFEHGRRQIAKSIVRRMREVCDEYASAFAAGHVMGTARSDLGESFRVFTHKRWVVVFRPIDGGIEVLRVIDGSRDFGRLFGS
jgi:toxin ParE1/3/4